MKVFAIASVLGGASATYPDDVVRKYVEWQTAYGAGNGNDSELDNFAANLARIEELRLADPSATYGHMSPFANLSPEEFAAYKGFASPPASARVHGPRTIATEDLPESLDWREKGAVNAIRDQKQCGSCWAFSVVANLEGAGFVETGQLVEVSEQQLNDCSKSTGDMGCQGGLPENTFQAMINTGMGLEYRDAYPYVAKDMACTADASQEVLFIKTWEKFSTDEDQIAAALVQYGPLSIGINANTLQLYQSGVADPSLCSPLALDHGVAIIGFGVDGQDYWTIRNSWGRGWGEEGYFRMSRGKGTCGLNTDVTSAHDITIDGSIPVPPKPTVDPNSCEAKNVASLLDCRTYCADHGGFASFRTPGPHCECTDGDGCDGATTAAVSV